MRGVTGAQGVEGAQGNAAAVAGGDGGGKPAHVAGQGGADVRRHRHAQPEGDQRPAVLCGLKPEHRHAGVAHSPQPVEPCVTLEIESAGFDRTSGGRQMGRGHHPHARLRVDPCAVAMERHPHPQRRARRRDAGDDHAVQRDAHCVRAAAVQRHHAPFDGAVIAPAQHRPRHGMRAHRGQQCARQYQHHGSGACARQQPNIRFKPQREKSADAYGQTHRHPVEQMPPLDQHRVFGGA